MPENSHATPTRSIQRVELVEGVTIDRVGGTTDAPSNRAPKPPSHASVRTAEGRGRTRAWTTGEPKNRSKSSATGRKRIKAERDEAADHRRQKGALEALQPRPAWPR